MKPTSKFPPLRNRKRINLSFRCFLVIFLLLYEAALILIVASRLSIDLGMIETRTESQPGILCCDRSHYRTDTCYMQGDIRTDSRSSSILLYNPRQSTKPEKIKPYTRKWESDQIMKTIDEITLKPINATGEDGRKCDVHHKVPGVIFSTGGYTGNIYHEFNDGLIPLYMTVERFGGEVIMVVLEYHSWWMSKYKGVVNKLTNYEVVDFRRDKRVHCFPEMIVGLKIHGELTIDPLLDTGKTIWDFQALLGQGLLGTTATQDKQVLLHAKRPKLVIFIRNKSRVLLNRKGIVTTCEKIGFEVHILNPKRYTQLSEIYSLLNPADAMIGVHGAAMTHFLFMRPGSVFIQIVPLGLSWAAQEYYGEPARKLGLEYMEYQIEAKESSLSEEYGPGHTVVVDPVSVNSKGWLATKKIYLQKQNVKIDVKRFRMLVLKAYWHIKRLQSTENGRSNTL